MKTIWDSDGTDEPVLICPPPRRDNIETAKRYGKEAFRRGLKCAPIFDQRYQNLDYWCDMPMMEAWIMGWHEANLID